MKDDRRVVITGVGVIAGNGCNKEKFIQNCEQGVSGIKKCTVFPTRKLRTEYFGQAEGVPVCEPDTWEQENRMEVLMKAALREMYKDASCSREMIGGQGTKACLCLGSLMSTIGDIMAYTRREERGWLEHSVDFTAWLRKESGVWGGIYVDCAACASSTASAGMAYDFIKNGLYDMAVVGGADPLSPVSAYGFHALQSLSRGICRPFDEERDGINIGEGAAFFLFETLQSAKQRNARIYGEILGYGLNNDAYHVTSPDPEGAGAVASMGSALREAGIASSQVGLINAHGTGTRLNDAMELKAIRKVFGSRAQDLYVDSTKALIGHCMGASGALEMAAVLLEMRDGTYLPMPGLNQPMEGSEDVFLGKQSGKLRAKYALSNSFAFAGNTASILLGAYEE